MANPNTIPYYRYQDIQVPDVTIRQEFENYMSQGQYAQALALLTSNAEQLSGKAFVADLVNALSNGILTLEQLFETNVVEFLDSLETDNQDLIDSLIKIGIWNINNSYSQNNFVVYNNLIYFCIKDTPANTQISDTEYWLQLGLKGATGAPGLDVVLRYNWSPTATYQVNDVVVYNNNFYVCIVQNQNILPTLTNYWQPFIDLNKAEIFVGNSTPVEYGDNTIWFQTESDPNTTQPGDAIVGQFKRYVQIEDMWEDMNPNVLLGQVQGIEEYAISPLEIPITILSGSWVDNEWSYTYPTLGDNNVVEIVIGDNPTTLQSNFFDCLEVAVSGQTITLTKYQDPVEINLIFKII